MKIKKCVAMLAVAGVALVGCTGNPEREAAQKASTEQQKKYETVVPFPDSLPEED